MNPQMKMRTERVDACLRLRSDELIARKFSQHLGPDYRILDDLQTIDRMEFFFKLASRWQQRIEATASDLSYDHLRLLICDLRSWGCFMARHMKLFPDLARCESVRAEALAYVNLACFSTNRITARHVANEIIREAREFDCYVPDIGAFETPGLLEEIQIISKVGMPPPPLEEKEREKDVLPQFARENTWGAVMRSKPVFDRSAVNLVKVILLHQEELRTVGKKYSLHQKAKQCEAAKEFEEPERRGLPIGRSMSPKVREALQKMTSREKNDEEREMEDIGLCKAIVPAGALRGATDKCSDPGLEMGRKLALHIAKRISSKYGCLGLRIGYAARSHFLGNTSVSMGAAADMSSDGTGFINAGTGVMKKQKYLREDGWLSLVSEDKSSGKKMLDILRLGKQDLGLARGMWKESMAYTWETTPYLFITGKTREEAEKEGFDEEYIGSIVDVSARPLPGRRFILSAKEEGLLELVATKKFYEQVLENAGEVDIPVICSIGLGRGSFQCMCGFTSIEIPIGMDEPGRLDELLGIFDERSHDLLKSLQISSGGEAAIVAMKSGLALALESEISNQIRLKSYDSEIEENEVENMSFPEETFEMFEIGPSERMSDIALPSFWGYYFCAGKFHPEEKRDGIFIAPLGAEWNVSRQIMRCDSWSEIWRKFGRGQTSGETEKLFGFMKDESLIWCLTQAGMIKISRRLEAEGLRSSLLYCVNFVRMKREKQKVNRERGKGRDFRDFPPTGEKKSPEEILVRRRSVEFITDCDSPWFEHLQSGVKTVEGRKSSPKWRLIAVGDTIKFKSNRGEYLRMRVNRVTRYPDIESYLGGETLASTLPGVLSIEEGVKVYSKYFSPEEAEKDGMLALWVSRDAGIG